MKASLPLCLSLLATSAAATITLDPATAHHNYDGHGALSAGASSRLLRDYPEPQRSDILDYLFKPQFGASLQLLKAEIGGDCQSTDGSEPSPSHVAGEYNCTGSYEYWLFQEAKLRNPSIQTMVLSWGVPFHIGNGSYFSPDNLAYQTNYVKCIHDNLGFEMDYIGIWNERSWGSVEYVSSLRDTLDAAGFTNTKIVIPDGGDPEGIVAAAVANSTFKNAIDVVGVHYPCHHPCPTIESEIGKTYWASEDYSTVANWAGAACWGRLLNQNYVKMNQTSTISWSLIWSVYPDLPYFGNGLMYAMSPWSGNYSGGGSQGGIMPLGDPMNGPLWTSAHTTQFVEVGWKYLHVPGGGSGLLPNGGSYVTLVPSTFTDITIVLEKLEGACLRCAGGATTPETITFQTVGSLPGAGTTLHVWRTNETNQFWKDADIVIAADRTFSIYVPSDSQVTLSTIDGAQHGVAANAVPLDQPFPATYTEDFNEYLDGSMAKYFSDQAGSFAVFNSALHQLVPVDPGPNAWVHDPDPVSLLGNSGVNDLVVQVTTTFNDGAPSILSKLMISDAGDDTESAADIASFETISAGAIYKAARNSAMRSHFADLAATSTTTEVQMKTGSKRNDILLAISGDATKMEKVGSGDIPAGLSQCDSTSKFQTWSFDSPASGYLSNGVGSSQLCLNVPGCDETQPLIYYQCLTSGGTCCGADCYQGLQFALDSSSGHITSALSSNKCMVALPTNGAVGFNTCSPTLANASWTYTASKQLQLTGTSMCLTTPPTISTYTQVCGRITGYSGFSGTPPTGYCFLITDDGSWILRSSDSPLAQGVYVPSGGGNFNPMTPTTLTLVMKGTTISAYVNDPTRSNAPIASVVDTKYTGGMTAVGSGYHYAVFDNFSTVPA